MKIIIAKRGTNKSQERQVMHSAVVHHPLTDAQGSDPPGQCPQFIYWAGRPLAENPLWLVQISCPGHEPSRISCSCSLAEPGKKKLLNVGKRCSAAAQTPGRHQRYSRTKPKPQHSSGYWEEN